MVRRIKRKVKKTVNRQGTQWVVGFDRQNQAAIYIHKHDENDDHSECGPVIACCKRAAQLYEMVAPELHATVARYESQTGQHIATWLDSGVNALYFAICDPDADEGLYQFGLPAERARRLLHGQDSRSRYFRPEHHSWVSKS